MSCRTSWVSYQAEILFKEGQEFHEAPLLLLCPDFWRGEAGNRGKDPVDVYADGLQGAIPK